MDYWEASKKNVFVDANKLLHDLVHFDKDNIPDKVIQKIQPYVKMPEFTPKAIEKASKACTALCMWALAMNTYHFVALQVEPKRKMLADAQAELEVTLSQLASAQAELKGVNDRLSELEKGFNEAVAKKEALANQVQQCQVQLSNAGKLIGGLGGEETRWRATTKQLAADLSSLPGTASSPRARSGTSARSRRSSGTSSARRGARRSSGGASPTRRAATSSARCPCRSCSGSGS